MAKSRAEVTWNGNLFQGSGTARSESGVIPEVPVSWASRIERTKGKTSPEELIAMAHASCFAMALSNTLDKAGSPPTRLEITAVVAFEKVGEGNKITTSELEVRGEVPGIDQTRFEELARQGEQGCPVSNALRNNVQITVKAELLGS